MGAVPPGKFPVPKAVRNVGAFLVAFAALVGFVYMFGTGIVDTFTAPTDAPPKVYDEAFLYVATVLAGLVGGLVAVGFGQKYALGEFKKDDGTEGTKIKVASTNDVTEATASVTMLKFVSLGNLVMPSISINARAILASIYTLVYILCGVGAVFIWATRAAQTPDLVKNLATTFLGLALPIVIAWFSE